MAVIGAGAAGLVSIHELRKNGHQVTCFESESELGGTWCQKFSRRSSMYNSLRTNLPRQVMSFDDFSFDSNLEQIKSFGGDPRQFPGHVEVQCYLKAFAQSKGLVDAIQFQTLVTSVQKTEDGLWLVETENDNVKNS